LCSKLFLDCNLDLARDRVIARHVRGGASLPEARRKYETNDWLNAQRVCESRASANWIIQLAPVPRLIKR
jgi:pantothenate kinase